MLIRSSINTSSSDNQISSVITAITSRMFIIREENHPIEANVFLRLLVNW